MSSTFGQTPQGASLLRQIATAHSAFKRDGLRAVYAEAAKYYESPTYDSLASSRVNSTRPLENIMSLELALAANTAALEANTAALLASKGTATASTGTATTGETTKPAKADKKPKEEAPKSVKTREELASAMGAYKEKFGVPKAKEIILNVGGTAALADVAVDKIDGLFEAATKAVEEAADDL